MKLTTSLHRLGSSLVNSYLIEESGLVTIIDAGLPGYWSELPKELAAMGRSLDDVRAVVLTHGDTDHIGFAERIRRERGIPISDDFEDGTTIDTTTNILTMPDGKQIDTTTGQDVRRTRFDHQHGQWRLSRHQEQHPHHVRRHQDRHHHRADDHGLSIGRDA